MERFIQKLEADLEAVLLATSDEKEVLVRYKRSAQQVNDALVKLRAYVRSHPFPNRAAEVRYFKEYAPRFYGRLFYFAKICQVEVERPYAAKEKIEGYLREELRAIDAFYARHPEFCRYYLLKDTYMDEQLFTKGAWENAVVEEAVFIMAEDYCVGSYWAARLRSNLELKGWLEGELAALQHRGEAGLRAKSLPVLEWTDSLTDLVELIYGIYLAGSFKNGNAGIKEIAEWFEAHLGLDLGGYYNTFQEIARRKKSQTKYVDGMKERLLKRMEEMEED